MVRVPVIPLLEYSQYLKLRITYAWYRLYPVQSTICTWSVVPDRSTADFQIFRQLPGTIFRHIVGIGIQILNIHQMYTSGTCVTVDIRYWVHKVLFYGYKWYYCSDTNGTKYVEYRFLPVQTVFWYHPPPRENAKVLCASPPPNTWFSCAAPNRGPILKSHF